jgi:hypothetical protein
MFARRRTSGQSKTTEPSATGAAVSIAFGKTERIQPIV